MENVRPFLLEHLEFASSVHSNELRFVSGQAPAIRVEGGALRAFNFGESSSRLVSALHEECSKNSELSSSHEKEPAIYCADFGSLGSFRCEFRRQGGTTSLLLFRELAEPLVMPVAVSHPPALGAGAKPEDSERSAHADTEQGQQPGGGKSAA
jgi:hypothetical protein